MSTKTRFELPAIHKTYRKKIERSLQNWPEFSWLHHFLSTPKPGESPPTVVHIIDVLKEDTQVTTVRDDLSGLDVALRNRSTEALLRVQIMCHQDSWTTDRDVLDLVASRFTIDPRVVSSHFDYATSRSEKHCPKYLSQALKDMDYKMFEHKHGWTLGGQIVSPYEHRFQAVLRLCYRDTGITLIIGEDVKMPTVLILLREDVKQGMDTSIFWDQNYCALLSEHANAQRPRRLMSDYIIDYMERLSSSVRTSSTSIIHSILPTIIDPFVGNAYGYYHRRISPSSLKPYDASRYDSESLFTHLREVKQMKNQITGFLAHAPEWQSHVTKHTISILEELISDVHELQNLYRFQQEIKSTSSLEELVKAQARDMKESLKTSEQMRRLSGLAYIMLPIQMLSSVFDANPKIFGLNFLSLNRLMVILPFIYVLLALPMILHYLFKVEVWARSRDMWRLSWEVAFVHLIFHYTHGYSYSDFLWTSCGIYDDIEFYNGRRTKRRRVEATEWEVKRKQLIRRVTENPFSVFSKVWKNILLDVFATIDKPRWNGSKVHDL